MDKNFLGLGIVFNAIDNGLTSQAKRVKDALRDASDAAEHTEESFRGKGKKGIFAGVSEGLKTLTLSKVAHDISSINDSLAGRGGGLNDVALQMDMLQVKMAAAFNPKVAGNFTSKVMGMIPAFGLTGHEAEQVAMSFTNSGAKLDDIKKTLPLVGTLVGKLGMDAGAVSQTFGSALGTLNMSADGLKDMTQQIFKMQKQYHLTDLMSPMPEIIENVYKNSIRFGKVNGQQAKAAVVDITKMAAAFQKVGYSQQQAIHMATSWNDHMSDIKESILDIQAGLEPSSDSLIKLQEAIASGGLSPDKVMSMITGGADMSAIMKELQTEISGLNEQGQKNMIQRLKRVFGPELTTMLGPLADSMDAVNDEAQKQDKTLGSASDEFKKFDKALDGTLTVTQKVTNAKKEFLDVITTLTNKTKYLDVLHKQGEAFDYLTKAVGDQNNVLGQFQKLAQGLEHFGLGFLFPEASKLNPVLDVFTRLLIPVTSLLGLFQIFKGPLSFIGSGLSKIGAIGARSLGMLAGGFARILGPVGLAVTAFELLYNFWTPFHAGVDAIVKAFNESFGPALTKIWTLVKGLFTDFSGTWPKLGDELSGIGEMLVKGWGAFTTAMGNLFYKAVDYIGDHWKEWLTTFVDTMQSGVKFLVKWVPIAIEKFAGFLMDHWKEVLIGIVAGVPGALLIALNFLTGGRVFKRIGEACDKLMVMVKEKFNDLVDSIKTMWDGFVDYFTGIPAKLIDSLKNMFGGFGGLFEGFKNQITSVFSGLADMLKNPFAGLGSALASATSSLAGGMKSLMGGIFDALPDFILNFLKGEGPIGSLLQGGKSLLGKVAGFFSGSTEVAPKIESSATMAQTMPTTVASAPTMPISAGPGKGAAMATPTAAQPMAPTMSPMAGADLKPTIVPQLADQNFQALVQIMAETKDTLAGLLAQLLQKPVQVNLQGDARKMLSTVGRQATNDAGALGMNAALGR